MAVCGKFAVNTPTANLHRWMQYVASSFAQGCGGQDGCLRHVRGKYANGKFASVDAVRGNIAFCGEYARECTFVHDRSNGTARHEIARNAPPRVIFLTYVKI